MESKQPQILISQVKMFKLAEDPCFGKKFETHEQCPACWIKQSCFVTFRNRK